jgi:hypothetical protein
LDFEICSGVGVNVRKSGKLYNREELEKWMKREEIERRYEMGRKKG